MVMVTKMRFYIHKELNEDRLFNPRFRRFKKISTSTIIMVGDEFLSGEKMNGVCFVIFGRMISLYITRAMKPKFSIPFFGWDW